MKGEEDQMTKIHPNVLAALVAAIASVIVAAVTTYGTIAVTKPQAQEVQARITSFSQSYSGLPVGAIVTSMLGPAEFARSVGDDKPGTTQKFVLADGRSVPNSAYAAIVNDPDAKVPDLRAMFLRGMNEGRDGQYADPESRKPGEPQRYATAQPVKAPFLTGPAGVHTHQMVWANSPSGSIKQPFTPSASVAGDKSFEAGMPVVQSSGDHLHVVTGGGDFETRPNNVPVYYYIKIN